MANIRVLRAANKAWPILRAANKTWPILNWIKVNATERSMDAGHVL